MSDKRSAVMVIGFLNKSKIKILYLTLERVSNDVLDAFFSQSIKTTYASAFVRRVFIVYIDSMVSNFSSICCSLK